MPRFSLPYGQKEINLQGPDEGYIGTYLPVRESVSSSGLNLVEDALDNPIVSKPLEKLMKKGQQVVIVISDMTRPCPNKLLLPPLLVRLYRAGIPREDIKIVVALGLHRKMSEEELRQSVGAEVYDQVQVINHDVEDVVTIGTTSRGTPVEVFRPIIDADFRICIGNVEFHYFAGFSGGAKAIVPGAASQKTVNANHSHMIKDTAVAASLEGNPVREDLEEAVGMVGVQFLLNVIVNENHQVISAAAGHVHAAHRHLCQQLSSSGLVEVPELLDVAIVSAGGHPKDVNLYQAQKGLDNIAGVVKPGGTLILLAECGEGFGSDVFEKWLTSGKKTNDLLEDIKNEFVLGGHKAAAIARVAQSINVSLVTSNDFYRKDITGIDIYSDVEDALSKVFKTNVKYAVFPLGASTLAVVK